MFPKEVSQPHTLQHVGRGSPEEGGGDGSRDFLICKPGIITVLTSQVFGEDTQGLYVVSVLHKF